MKILISLCIVFVSTMINPDLYTVRQGFKHVQDSEDNITQFYELTKVFEKEEGSIGSAYHGVALTLKASIAKSRGDKIRFFKQGKQRIEAAIAAQPNTIELRMIRLSVQSNAPKITRYYKQIEEDKQFLEQHVENVKDAKLKTFIKGFMQTSKVFALP